MVCIGLRVPGRQLLAMNNIAAGNLIATDSLTLVTGSILAAASSSYRNDGGVEKRELSKILGYSKQQFDRKSESIINKCWFVQLMFLLLA